MNIIDQDMFSQVVSNIVPVKIETTGVIEQVHILGSRPDMLRFQEYVRNQPSVLTPTQVISSSIATESLQESLRSVSPVALSNLSALGPLQGEMVETEQGQIGVNKQQLLFLLGPTMYSKPLADVAVKELLQNSFDAVKARQNFQKQITESTPGNIQITLDYKNRTIAIQDDGVGMTPEIVKNAFLSIGGTNKEGLDVSERSGGFGLAKVQFLLGSEYVKVSTVRDGVRTFLQATAVQLYNDDFVINRELTNEPNGTYVEIKIPESYTTPEGTVRPISFPGGFKSQGQTHTAFDILNNPLIGDVNVTLDVISDKPHKYTLPLGRNVTEELLPPLFSKIEFDWGTADLYMSVNSYEDNSTAKHKILSSGIYQFDERFTLSSEKIPYDIVVNIKPSVSTTAEQYPFNNQREGFKRTVSEDIKALSLYLAKYAAGEANKALASSFSDIVSLPKVDPTVNLEPEERNRIFESVTKTVKENKEIEVQPKRREVASISVSKGVVKNEDTGEIVAATSEKSYKESFKTDREIARTAPVESSAFNPVLPQYHNNTTFNYLEIPGAAEFFSDFGSVVLDTVRFAGNKLGYDYKKLRSEDVPFFAGVSIDKGYAGVHVRNILNGIFINPLAFKAESLEEAVGQALHIVIHEINHTTVSGEGAEFTTALALLYGKIYGTGQYGLYEALFRAVYKKHFETYKVLRNEYTKSTTRNLSKGFSGDKIQGGASRDVQRNVDDVQAGQVALEGYTGDQYDNTRDRVGDVILSNINQALESSIPDAPLINRAETQERFLEKYPEALIARTGHKSLQDLAADYQFDLNTEKGQLGLIKELLARQAEVNPNLKLNEVLKTAPASVPLVIPLNSKAQINTAYADSLESPSDVDVMDSFLDELLLTGEIEAQPSGLFFTDGYTFETREELKTYIQNKPTANLVTHHFYPSLELKGRTAREAIDQTIDEHLTRNGLTKEKDYYQAEGRLSANRVAKELNKYFKNSVVVAVGDKVKVQVPHQLYAAYEPKEVISTQNIDNPYADVYVTKDFPVLFGDANILKSYDPTIAEDILRIMQAKKNIGLVVKSHAPSLFWKTLEQLNLASIVDGTYYYVEGLVDQKAFDDAYAQLKQNPDSPIGVTGLDEFSEVVGEYRPMNDMDLMYCNV